MFYFIYIIERDEKVMITLLSKIFIKNHKEYKNPDVRRRYGMLTSIVGICLNILLFLGKYFAGIVSGSIAVTADAFNNLSDAGSSFMTLVGFKFAGMKPDKEHPFGHGRFEYVAGLGVSMAIILMGFELLKSSVDKVLNPSVVNMDMLTMVILIVSICVKIYMAVYNLTTSKKIDSPAMKATGMDSLSDTIATAVVFASAIVSKVFQWNIDGYCGIMVAFLILYAGYSAAKETISPLLGTAPSQELVEEIKGIVMAHDEIVGIHDLIVHDYGPGRMIISLHGEVSGDEDVFVLHDAIDRIERELGDKLNCEAVIHMDPIAVNDELVNNTKTQVEELVISVDQRLTIHDFRMVTGTTHTNLIFDILVPYGLEMTDEQIKRAVEELICKKWNNYFAVIKVDKSYV